MRWVGVLGSRWAQWETTTLAGGLWLGVKKILKEKVKDEHRSQGCGREELLHGVPVSGSTVPRACRQGAGSRQRVGKGVGRSR